DRSSDIAKTPASDRGPARPSGRSPPIANDRAAARQPASSGLRPSRQSRSAPAVAAAAGGRGSLGGRTETPAPRTTGTSPPASSLTGGSSLESQSSGASMRSRSTQPDRTSDRTSGNFS